MSLIRRFEDVTLAWLSTVLGEEVADFELTSSASNWATSASITTRSARGERRSLWLKLCLGNTFGRSEVDYYLNDYIDLPDSPVLKCYDACYDQGVGYHILLDDLSAEFRDRKTAEPTLAHGLALAKAIARLHSHHWERGTPASETQWETYFSHIEPGVGHLEAEIGHKLREDFDAHAERLRKRWSDPNGQTLLHGDINPTNVLTPKTSEAPVFILDRQPFDWGITYGLAVYDLAYAIVPWWPHEFRASCQEQILRCWFETLSQSGYSWEQARADWELSVEHCLHVPIEWCSEPGDRERMRGLWEWQFGNITGKPIRSDQS